MMTSLHASFNKSAFSGEFDEDVIRHIILNMIRAVKTRYSKKYGEVVLCCDSTRSWRKEIFPYYKAHRKNARQKQEHINWKLVFELFSSIKDELCTYSDYAIVEVDRAEGDDVIAALAMKYHNTSHIIISADKDFVQLQAYLNVAQYDPIRSNSVKELNPQRYLEEHILEGDRGDGIPNILSDDDTFVDNSKRQKPLTQKISTLLLESNVDSWDNPKYQKNWRRNRQLIDLRMMPPDLAKQIAHEYKHQISIPKKRQFYQYFVKYGLTNLLDSVGEF